MTEAAYLITIQWPHTRTAANHSRLHESAIKPAQQYWAPSHTHNCLTAFCSVATGFTHSHPRGRRRIPTDNKVHWAGAHPLYGASCLCQQGLLDPIKPVHNQSAGWLAPLTDNGSVCRKSWSQFLYNYCLQTCGFYGAGKDNRGRRTDNPSGRHPIRSIGAPTSIIPHFYAKCPFWRNPPNLSWLWTGTDSE